MKTFLRLSPILFLIAAMFCAPQDVISAAAHGLKLWANYIVPALFPFFVVTELLMKQGFVHFLGALLDPLMRPLFRLPGQASFVLAMTHISGIPIGAILTSRLRLEGALSKIQGERLLAFTCNPSPGYMLGAVAAGMLGHPALGAVIAGSVYGANFLVGLIFRFYGADKEDTKAKHRFSLREAWRELENARRRNQESFGQTLANAVRESISTILFIGGFIALFSVITRMLTISHITTLFAVFLNLLSGGFLTFPHADALLQGFLETTLGCQAASQNFATLHGQISATVFLLGWAGLSSFAQVAGFTATTDMSLKPFVLGRFLHSFFSLAICQLILTFGSLPAAAPAPQQPADPWLFTFLWSSRYFFLIFALFLTLFALFRLSALRRRL